MKGKTLMLIGVLAAIAGAVLVLFHQSVKSTGVIVVGGILFLAIGLINLVFFNQGGGAPGTSRLLTQISNTGSIILGLSMLLYQSTFVPLVTFMFGLMIAVSALWQFFMLALGTRPYQLPGWLYLFPLLIAADAVFVFLQRGAGHEENMMLAAGIGLALLGVGCIIEGATLGSARHAAKKAAKAGPTPQEVGADEQWQQGNAHGEAKPEEPKREAKPEPQTTEDLDDVND